MRKKADVFLFAPFLLLFWTKSIEFLLNCTDCNLILAERPAGNEAIDHTEGSGLVEEERERERERGLAEMERWMERLKRASRNNCMKASRGEERNK